MADKNTSQVKITAGIITFHEAYSYGAVLQCTALMLFLSRSGIEASVINYSMNAYIELRKKKPINAFMLRLYNLLQDPIGRIKIEINERKKQKLIRPYRDALTARNKSFDDFRCRYLIFTEKRYNTVSDLVNDPPTFDVYICGSDQIWNPRFSDFDANYFLQFAPAYKRIAYAPSFGISRIPVLYREELRRRVRQIPYMSIREKYSAEIIKEICGIESEVMVDPTFLIDAETWKSIAARSDVNLPEKYILTYFIGIDDYIQSALDMLEHMFPEHTLVNLIFDQSSYGPEDFLKMIAKAELVITNSFHGCAFCINMNVQFWVIKTLKDMSKNSAFGRIEHMLCVMGVGDRILEDVSKLRKKHEVIDYQYVNEKRKEYVSKAENFLLSAIKTICEGK